MWRDWRVCYDQRGVTIAETLVAMVVFMIAAGGMVAGTVTTIEGNTVSRKQAAATALVQEKIEHFRSVGSAGDSAELSDGQHYDANNPISPLGENGGYFNRSWVVYADTPDDGITQVEVTVSWQAPYPSSMTSVALVCGNTSCLP